MQNAQRIASKEQFKPSGTKYRVNYSSTNKESLNLLERAAIIADALVGKHEAVRLVATSDGSMLEMEKNWDLMTELDKDEVKMRSLRRRI